MCWQMKPPKFDWWESPKKLDVTSLMANIATASKTITLSSFESLDAFQKVTVNIKVLELKDETQVGGRVKWDVLQTKVVWLDLVSGREM